MSRRTGRTRSTSRRIRTPVNSMDEEQHCNHAMNVIECECWKWCRKTNTCPHLNEAGKAEARRLRANLVILSPTSLIIHDDAFWNTELEHAIERCHSVEQRRYRCDTCIPIGKRKKSCRITDGRFDTKESCCYTRSHSTGCPVSVDIALRRKQEVHDAAIVAAEEAKWLPLVKQAALDGIKAGSDRARENVLDACLSATDDCWRRMHHGHNSHHHQMKRDLFLRFRKSIESLKQTTGTVDPVIVPDLANLQHFPFDPCTKEVD